VPEIDGAPRVTFAAVVLAAMASLSLSLFGGLVPLMALALRGHSCEVKHRRKLNLAVSERAGRPPAASRLQSVTDQRRQFFGIFDPARHRIH